MPLYKHGEKEVIFTPERPIEQHFHDYDETWVILRGSAQARLVPAAGGPAQELLLEPGDVWMINIGDEHEAMPLTPEFVILPFPGTIPPDAKRGHLYLAQERYRPTFQLVRTPVAEERT